MSKGHWRPLQSRSQHRNKPCNRSRFSGTGESTSNPTNSGGGLDPSSTDQTPRWSQMGYFRCKSTTWYNHSPSRDIINNNDLNETFPIRKVIQPYRLVRVRKRHKVRERIHSPINLMGGPGLGPIVSKRNIKSSDVSGRISAALEKLFRSKSQRSRRVLEYLQLDLLGHVITTPTYLRETAKFLCIREGIVRVYKKPSFKAVRCLLSVIKDCETTSYQIGACLRHFALCIP